MILHKEVFFFYIFSILVPIRKNKIVTKCGIRLYTVIQIVPCLSEKIKFVNNKNNAVFIKMEVVHYL